VAAAIAVASVAAPGAAVQVGPPPPSGVRVGDQVRFRIHNMASPKPIEATFSGWRGDTLVLALPNVEAPWLLSADQLRFLERYQALTPRHGLRRGLALGLVTGLFVGAAVGGGLYAAGVTHDEDGPPAEQLIASVLRFTGLFAVGGGISGGILGGRNPGWGWVGVSLPPR